MHRPENDADIIWPDPKNGFFNRRTNNKAPVA
jgi:hypothetical protein